MHVNTTAIHGVNKVNKALMSDMLSRHQNWYIQKDMPGSLKIFNYDRSIARCVLLESIIRIDDASLCGLC